MIKLNGYFGGNFWNKDTRQMEIKVLGTKESGAILCGLNVSGKDQEGNRVYGKAVDVKVNIKDPKEADRVYKLISSGDSMCECEGFFVPNNYTKDGKEIRGNQFLVTDSTTFVVASNKPKAKNDDTPFEKDVPATEKW